MTTALPMRTERIAPLDLRLINKARRWSDKRVQIERQFRYSIMMLREGSEIDPLSPRSAKTLQIKNSLHSKSHRD